MASHRELRAMIRPHMQTWTYLASYIMPDGDAHMISGEVIAPSADTALDLAHDQLPHDAASVSMWCEAPHSRTR